MNKLVLLLAFLFIGVLPELAEASSGLSTFTSPIENLLALLSGTVAKAVLGISVCIAAFMLIVNSEEISGTTKKMLYIVIAAGLLASANALGDWFGFSGALI